MSFSLPVLCLYLMAAVVLLFGLVATATGRMPSFLQTSARPMVPTRTRLNGLELVLLGLLMVLSSFVYGGDGQTWRVAMVLFTWVGFAIVMLILRMVARRLEPQQRA